MIADLRIHLCCAAARLGRTMSAALRSHAPERASPVTSRRARRAACRVSRRAPPSARLQVIISGAPASGKGTQCELIAAKYGLTHVSAGDLLRAEVKAGSDAGNEAKKFMDNGQLVPNEVRVVLPPQKTQQAWRLCARVRRRREARATHTYGLVCGWEQSALQVGAPLPC